MRISLQWIRRLLGVERLPLSPTALQERIALSVTEIEGAERTGPALAGVVVGRVLTVEPHPKADRLRLTTVDIGSGAPLRIVCGAPNVAAGQTAAVATIGTTLSLPSADGSRTTVTIKAASLRGERSEGMLCAEDELGLGDGHDGILVLPDTLVPGTPLSEALGLGDTVWVVENHGITHRPDLWGQLGWAREIAAATALAPPAAPDIGWNDRGQGWSLRIEDEGCTTYCAAVVEGVANTPSPRWMVELLESCGVRPLGLLVDITNLVMLELGEPLHAFDVRVLRGNTIGVRAATAGERFTTLDEVERTLSAGDLLICDGEGPVALAGIMGGAGSMIREDTQTILLEGAVFRAERIRRTRQRTGLITDASARFEKGLYPELAPAGINRALALLEELCPGCRITHRLHHGPLAQEPREIRFTPAQVERLTGLAVEPSAQRAILERLGFRVSGDVVGVPWWRRKDVHQAVDLVEEVARHHGYEHIQPTMARLPAQAPPPNALRRAEHRARHALSAQGWDEVCTYALTAAAWIEPLGQAPAEAIHLQHPLSSEQTVLRPALLPGLAEALTRNRKHLAEVRIYELGKRYGRGAGVPGHDPDEALVIEGVVAAQAEEAPFYRARDALQALVAALGWGGLLALAAPAQPPPFLVASRTRTLALADGTVLGLVGELTPAVRSLAGCPERVGWFRLELEAALARLGPARPVRFTPQSRFQKVEREFTWVCPEQVPYGAIATATAEAAGATLVGVDLVTIYRGDPIPAGAKAVSVRVGLQAEDHTLEEQEIARVAERIVQTVSRQTGAQLRG